MQQRNRPYLWAPVHEVLRSIKDDSWPDYIRMGVVAVLQNRVGPAQKLQALVLAESTVSIVGEDWFIGKMNLSGLQDSIPVDRCMLLVLETSRVEASVLLNELAYLKFEASNNVSSTSELIFLKQSNLAIAFSLVEKIIKLISDIEGDEGSIITERTFKKVITMLDDTIKVVLEYLQDAKDRSPTKRNVLLASVRMIGSYLAEVPIASKEKVLEFLDYMLSIESEYESFLPFYYFTLVFVVFSDSYFSAPRNWLRNRPFFCPYSWTASFLLYVFCFHYFVKLLWGQMDARFWLLLEPIKLSVAT